MAKRVETGTRPGDVIVGRIGEDGNPTTDLETAQWTDFLNGTWTKERPTAPGVYPLANRDGQIVGEASFEGDCKGNIFCATHNEWDGWFFSRAMPKIPNRPPEVFPEDPPKNRPTLRLVK